MPSLSAPLRLVIWQDPTEAKHRLSTAPLLARAIQGSRLVVGERFAPQEILTSPIDQCLLVYPFTHKPAVNDDVRQHVQTLLLLDGTWRKVRKLLLNNPWLEQLPHWAMAPLGPSRYAIRQSPRADGVSTLEAGVAALEWCTERSYAPVLDVLDAMVMQQQAFGHGNKQR